MIDPPSPCTGICRIDQRNGWCEGCLRTLAEIADWPRNSVTEKSAVLERIKQRRNR